MPTRPAVNPRPGIPFTTGGTTVLNDGKQIVVTNPDGSKDAWDLSGPRGSAGRYLGPIGGGTPTAAPPQQGAPSQPAGLPSAPPAPAANNPWQFGRENKYLADGPKLPPDNWQQIGSSNPLLMAMQQNPAM